MRGLVLRVYDWAMDEPTMLDAHISGCIWFISGLLWGLVIWR